MNRVLKIILNVLIWGGILAYLVFAARYCRTEQQAEALGVVDIDVIDFDRLHTVSATTVRRWLDEAGIPLEGTPLDQVNTREISEVIGSHVFVNQISSWTDRSGVLHIRLSQREPVVRVITEDGYDFFVSHDNWILPTEPGKAEYVPVVTGRFTLPFERGWFGELAEAAGSREKKSDENYGFLFKLINFVRLTAEDTFWGPQIVQVNVSEKPGAPWWKEPEIEIIPRIGKHTIEMGTLDGWEDKLDRLRHFYHSVLDYEGWDLYSIIDIRNENQVVCRK